MKINKVTIGATAAALVAVFVIAAIWYRRSEPDSAAAVSVAAVPASGAMLSRAYHPTLGSEQAPVTIVEFFDPECETCRLMYPIVKQVMAEFEGRVKLVIRYMPLHRNSVYAATMLEAARPQNKYWEYLDVMMRRQPEWASHQAPRPDLLLRYAPGVGLDEARLQAAASDPQIRARIQQDQSDGIAFGARQTPTLFINGKVLSRLGLNELRTAVQAALK